MIIIMIFPLFRESNSSLHLFRSLAPAYLRIAGPDSNKLLFLSSQDNRGLSDPVSSLIKRNKNMLITGNYGSILIHSVDNNAFVFVQL